MPSVDRETTAARAAKDFDLLSAINGYPEDFSVFEGEVLFIRCARKPASTLPLPRPLVRALWRYRFGEAIRESMLKRAAGAHIRTPENPATYATRLELRDPITGQAVFEHKLPSPAPLFSELPANYRDRGADYTSRIALETTGLPPSVYECVVHDNRGHASQDIYVNVKPRSLEGIDLLCILPSFTWQAYNRIGGGSFYSPELGHRRTICSQRPMHHHSDNSIQPALALLSTFREQGLNVACVDSWDLHRGRCPAGNVPVAAILVHDEYCSASMRAQIERLLDEGTALLVLSGNTCWWHIDVDGPNISVNKAPARTALWHRAGVPEENTFVSSYRFGGYAIERARQKARLALRIRHLSEEQMYQAGAITAVDPQHPIFEGIALNDDLSFGADIPVVYRELDSVPLDSEGRLDRNLYKAPLEPHVIATGLTLYGQAPRTTGVVVEAPVRNGHVLHMGSIGWARGVWQGNADLKRIVVNAYRYCRSKAAAG